MVQNGKFVYQWMIQWGYLHLGNLQFDHHQKSWGVSNLNPKHPQTLRFHPKFQLSGRVAEIFFTALRDAASRGLDVVLLVDYIGAFALRQAGKDLFFMVDIC